MSRKTITAAMCSVMAVCSLASTGCWTIGIARGPNLGIFSIPIPVSPYLQKKEEDEAWNNERYDKVPVLGPITPGSSHVALDEPSDDEVMRALERARPVQGGIPLFHEMSRNNVRIVKELVADYVDPPRIVPLLGPVQLHHAHFKCTIFFEETKRVGWPIPYTVVNEDAQEVIYIDHNHFHMVGNVDTGKTAAF